MTSGSILRAALIGAALCAAGADAREIVPADLMDLPAADVVLLGEVHDNPEHHRHQALALSALRPAAVVFEMLDPAQAAVANRLGGTDPGLAEALGWADSGWPDWRLYAPVFAAVGDARVYGAAQPRADVRRAMTDGAAAVFGDGAARFGLYLPLPEAEQAAREAAQLSGHCDALPAAMLPGMVAAQRLRDAAFARTALRALEDTGGPVVVITGSGHARTDWGMPVALAAARPETTVVSLGQLEAPPEDIPPPFDLWLVTDPVDRPDPCAAFR